MGLPYEVGDIVTLKKVHPCGSRDWEILRVGADLSLIHISEPTRRIPISRMPSSA